MSRNAPIFAELTTIVPPPGTRVLCLAPPGELAATTRVCLEAVRAGGAHKGMVAALVEGEPFLHDPLPPELSIIGDDPGQPNTNFGPFDMVLAWGSSPFLGDLDAFLRAVRDATRPGGRIWLDLPAYGFSPILQACHPDAEHWVLPHRSELTTSLEQLGFRDVNTATWVEVRDYDTLADLIDDVVTPFPLRYEGRDGQAMLHTLRQNLASAFEGAVDLSLALRRVKARALR